jgi:hypothetical protein
MLYDLIASATVRNWGHFGRNMLLSLTKTRPIWQTLYSALLLVFLVVGVVSFIPLISSAYSQPTFEEQDTDERRVSIYVEQGRIVPSQPIESIISSESAYNAPESTAPTHLSALRNVMNSERSRIRFTITGGKSRFHGKQKQAAHASGEKELIFTPPIRAGSVKRDSYLNVLIDGQPISDPILVTTLPAGNIEKIKPYLEDNPGAIISLGEGYAVLDEARITNVPTDAVGVEYESVRVGRTTMRAQSNPCAETRVPWGPGTVIWHTDNLKSRGYSIRPEKPSREDKLEWPEKPSQDADAVYNLWWVSSPFTSNRAEAKPPAFCTRGFNFGSYFVWGGPAALKIPSSCDVKIRSAGYAACCNRFWAGLGKIPKPVKPGQPNTPQRDWAPCPLEHSKATAVPGPGFSIWPW